MVEAKTLLTEERSAVGEFSPLKWLDESFSVDLRQFNLDVAFAGRQNLLLNLSSEERGCLQALGEVRMLGEERGKELMSDLNKGLKKSGISLSELKKQLEVVRIATPINWGKSVNPESAFATHSYVPPAQGDRLSRR
jgi:hypothetical protein